jgi:hypothetical protein
MTQILYAGDGQSGGSLAGIGPRLLDTTAKAYIRLTLEGLGQQIQQQQMVDIAPAAGLDQEDTDPPAFPHRSSWPEEKTATIWRNGALPLDWRSINLSSPWLQPPLVGKKAILTLHNKKQRENGVNRRFHLFFANR